MTASDVRTLPQALARAAASKAVVAFHGARGTTPSRHSWKDILGEAEIWGRKLYAAGLAPGDRVGLAATTDPLFVSLFAACQVAGLVPVPLPVVGPFADRAAHCEKLEALLGAAGAKAALLPADIAARLPANLGAVPPSVIAALPEAARDFPEAGPADLCFIQFSSGSTRFPKGVMVSQGAVLANAGAIARGLEIGGGDVCVSWLPLYHDMGLVGCLLAPIVALVPLHLLPTPEFVRNPLLWPQILSQVGGTVSYAPAFGYELAARRLSPDAARLLDLTRWRVAGVGGDMVRPIVLDRFAEAVRLAGFDRRAFAVSYGLAEATLAVTLPRPGAGIATDWVDLELLEREKVASSADRGRSRSLARCGRALPGVELSVRDAEGRDLPERRVGRLFVRGPSVMSGYYGDEGETRRALSPEGWLDTGDLGYLADGELVVTGRAKDVIIVNGRNLWPHDLEWLAERVPPLRPGDVAAVAGETDEGAEQPVLLVQCRAREAGERGRLADAVAASVLAAAGVACRVVLVPPRALPRTSSGKLARAAARRLLAEGAFAGESGA